MTAVDPSVALGLRRALTSLRAHEPAVNTALRRVLDARGVAAQRAAAMEAGMQHGGIAHAGELVSRANAERDALILAATDRDVERAHALALSQKLAEPVVFRALRHVFPFSFRAPALDAWERYRAHLTSLLDRPVWPDRAVSLRALYVPSACVETLARPWNEHRDVAAVAYGDTTAIRDATPQHADPLPLLLAKMREAPAAPLLALEGEWGLGRSTVAQVLADHLARQDDAAPLLVHAVALREMPLFDALRDAFEHTGFHDLFDDLRWLPPLFLILDVDRPPGRELISEIRAECLRGTLSGALLARPPTNPWDQDPPLDGVELLPFDDGRARRWAARWNEHAHQRFDVEPFLRIDPDAEAESPPLNLSRQPLTLMLLAEMSAQGHALQGTTTLRGHAEVYREIITWRCRAMVPPQRLSGEREPVTAYARERAKLRRDARALHRERGQDPASTTWSRFSFSVVPRWPQGERVRPSSTARAGRDPDQSLSHDSFADYLVAEDIALGAARMTAVVGDVELDDVPALSAPLMAAMWIELVGGFTLSPTVVNFLDVMLPGWENFRRGARGAGRGFRDVWRRTVSSLYDAILDDAMFDGAWQGSPFAHDPPELVRARSLWALLRLASFPKPRRVDRFALSTATTGTFPRLLRILEAIPDGLSRCHDRISLAGAYLATERLDGAQLANLDFAGANLDHASLAGADLVWCNLAGATLRDARLSGARLDRACLDGADLRCARLDGASLVGASLKNALLLSASLRGVELSEAQRREAVLTEAEASARGLPLPPDGEAPF